MNGREGDGFSPRNRGLAILVGAATLVLVNLATARYMREYFAMIFPFAFGVAPVGVALLVSGALPEDIRAGKVAPPRGCCWSSPSMVAGVLGGLLANHAFAGRAR